MKGHEDLVKLISTTAITGGLDVSQEAINEYQDMIGHSTAEELRTAANGKNNETFYRIYGHAYGTTEAIKFYMKNSDKVQEILHERDDWQAQAEEEEERAKSMTRQYLAVNKQYGEALEELTAAQGTIEAQAAEIIELKAKLYDLMTK